MNSCSGSTHRKATSEASADFGQGCGQTMFSYPSEKDTDTHALGPLGQGKVWDLIISENLLEMLRGLAGSLYPSSLTLDNLVKPSFRN